MDRMQIFRNGKSIVSSRESMFYLVSALGGSVNQHLICQELCSEGYVES